MRRIDGMPSYALTGYVPGRVSAWDHMEQPPNHSNVRTCPSRNARRPSDNAITNAAPRRPVTSRPRVMGVLSWFAAVVASGCGSSCKALGAKRCRRRRRRWRARRDPRQPLDECLLIATTLGLWLGWLTLQLALMASPNRFVSSSDSDVSMIVPPYCLTAGSLRPALRARSS